MTIKLPPITSELVRRLLIGNFDVPVRQVIPYALQPDAVYHILVLDVDHMKEMNSQLGYDETTNRIKKMLSVLRADEYFVAQFQSGDEFVIILDAFKYGSEDIMRVIARLSAAGDEQGVSFTYLVKKDVPAEDGVETIKALFDQLVVMKAARRAANAPSKKEQIIALLGGTVSSELEQLLDEHLMGLVERT